MVAGETLVLPAAADRHARVRRVQPGDRLLLLDGQGAEWPATVRQVGPREIVVAVQAPQAVQRELPLAVTLAVVVPANERMDWLVEKATELGAAAVQPLQAERSVLRLGGERAAKRQAHWQGIARAATEQCGRTQLMAVMPLAELRPWLQALPRVDAGAQGPCSPARWLLSLADSAPGPSARARALGREGAAPESTRPKAPEPSARPTLLALSGPEGGLTPAEEAAACAVGFVPLSLGPRVLRADTAPLALLAWAGLALGD